MTQDTSPKVDEVTMEPPLLHRCNGVHCFLPASLSCPTCLKLNVPKSLSRFCSQTCFKNNWSTHKVIHAPGLSPLPLSSSFSVSVRNSYFRCRCLPSLRLPQHPPCPSPSPLVSIALLILLNPSMLAICDQQLLNVHKHLGYNVVAINYLGDWGKQYEYDPFQHQFNYTGSLRAVYPLSPMRTLPPHIQRPDYAESGYSRMEDFERRTKFIDVLNSEEIQRMRTACKIARTILDTAAKWIAPGVCTDTLDQVVHEACIDHECYPSPLNYMGFPKS
ncbi:Methionine aminopeptidase 1, partial [Coelomomyces lativittatus]